MNLAAALVVVSLGQPPAVPGPDYYPLNSRSIKLPIKYEKDRKAIRQVKLYVARNGENTWYQEAVAPPDRDAFTFVAKEDGIYWFTMVEEDLQGKTIPADLTRHPPDLKVLVDTLPPRVQFTNARRNGEEVVVEWLVDDKYPDENSTRVHFRPASGDGYWQEVTLPANSKSGVRFPAGTTAAVAVRVTAVDLAGNKTEAVREIGPSAGNTQTSTSMSPASPMSPVAPVATAPGGPLPPTRPAGGVIPPPDNLAPIPPTPPAGVGTVSPDPIRPPSATGALPLPTTDSRPAVPSNNTSGANSGAPAPVAVWSGGSAPTGPTIELTRAQVINYLNFDLNYEVETRGPSGISRVDLWVTRDDGRTWLKWSEHPGKNPTVRVNLNVPANPQPEGTYGFRLVPVSGAGLSEREPTAGDTPELRVVVDITPPQLDLFPPAGDPANPDTLVIHWKAADKNFGEDPITIEWSDKPTGPWQPAATGGEVVPAGATVALARRLANTGQFAWRVPAGLPPRVFLRVTARDAAGNVKEVITRDPILVDLVKPRAKISGIVGPGGSPRP